MSKFKEGDSEGPDVGFNAVFSALDPFRLRGKVSDRRLTNKKRCTLMYTDVPTNVLAMELMSSPETPKSISLIAPSELHRILEGLISVSDTSGYRAGCAAKPYLYGLFDEHHTDMSNPPKPIAQPC